nr:Z1 domain-containing protein [Terribacillus saccharophilus]
MQDLSHPNFDIYRNWIRKARNNGWSWEEISTVKKTDPSDIQEFLRNLASYDFKDPISTDQWEILVSSVKKHEETIENIQKRSMSAMVTDTSQNNGSEIPMDSRSSWQLYKEELRNKGFKDIAIDEIERSSASILKRLNINTVDSGPVKGMVVGNVQSGKTSNMAGLMAMAADHGWNVFVVLSGLIENLRIQTQKRLINDLNHQGNIGWQAIDDINAYSFRTQNLHLEEGKRAYLYVCLKNKKRLEDLIFWMQRDPHKYKQMKVLVIDDEADQGSINTADVHSEERKTLNRLIVNLVEGKDKEDRINYSKPKAMNYISYTATPYANFLNEYSTESLYPRNFIKTLSTVNEYFGPKEIFGVEGMAEYQGMDIIRDIDDEDYLAIKLLQERKTKTLPSSLLKSICWFLCSAASMKLNGYKKPISMMIHTSQKQQHHTAVAEAVKNWLTQTSREEILSVCEKVWKRETSDFTVEDFTNSYPEYAGDFSKMYLYPEFKMIEASIVTLINDVTHIPLGDNGQLNYHENIHLCVDNCSNNGINEDGMFMRLAYPDDQKNQKLDHATAFIIVGGATLSRGLTIEGLVSTYFLRSTIQADSLMQMGRWFGYRSKYELYPRLWMTDDTREKFEFLSTLEYELRETLKQYSDGNADPSLFGPRVKNTPSVSWMRVTAKNRQQSAVNIEFDYTGTSPQTIFFPNNPEILKSNLEITKEFLSSLNEPFKSEISKSSYVFRGVPFSKIAEYLNEFYFHEKTRTFSKGELNSFTEWISKMTEDGKLSNWNIVIAGKGNTDRLNERNSWEFTEGGTRVGKVTRNRKNRGSDTETINIGVLRAPSDLYADVLNQALTDDLRKEINNNNTNWVKVRQDTGLGDVPLLIIYCIDKDSEFISEKNTNDRSDLDSQEDIIGLSISVPGVDTNKGVQYGGLQIKIPAENLEGKGGYEEE